MNDNGGYGPWPRYCFTTPVVLFPILLSIIFARVFFFFPDYTFGVLYFVFRYCARCPLFFVAVVFASEFSTENSSSGCASEIIQFPVPSNVAVGALSDKTETTAGVHGFSRSSDVSDHWDFDSTFCKYCVNTETLYENWQLLLEKQLKKKKNYRRSHKSVRM